MKRPPPTASNLLVVSDLHLGGALRPPFGFKALRLVVRLDQELCRFMDYHRLNPLRDADGAPVPWTLVFNGDTLDFLHMDLRPAKTDAPSEEERLFGLDFDERRSRWKLEQIVRYHRRGFAGLGRFVDAGNTVVFVAGNHDADLFFKGVRDDLVEHIARNAKDPAAARGRVQLAPWFYFEEGRAYIEHGHRFDAYATFPDPLNPIAAHRERHLAPTFGHWALKFFCNRVPSFPVHDVDTWTAGDFIQWARQRPLWRIGGFYISFIWRYLRSAALDRGARESRPERERRRFERLRKFARAAKMPIRRIQALDRMRESHLGSSVLRVMQGLYMDRFVLGVLGVLGVGAAAIGLDGGTALWVSGVIAALVISGWAWSWKTRPSQDVEPIMARVAKRIGRLTGAPIIVFGHTHRVVLEALGRRTSWVNPGSWEHLPRQKLHAAGAVCTCHAQYAVITGYKRTTEARLMRWCRRTRAPIAHVAENQI